MSTIGQKGVAQIFVVAGLVAAIALVVFLVQMRTNLLPQAQSSGATLSLNPSSKTVGKSCSFDIDINLNTGGRNTDGTDVILLYDPAKLSVVSVSNGDIYANYPPSSIDNNTGKVRISGLAPPSQPYNGAGRFATLILKAMDITLPDTPAKFSFDFDLNNTYKTTDSNVVENGTITDVLVSVENGSYVIGTGPCGTDDEGGPLRGDVNGDGKVTDEDVVELKKYMDISLANIRRADLDGDGKITLEDYNILYALVTRSTPAPTCVPRPACLDAEPACKIAQTEDMCPPAPGCLNDSQCSDDQRCDFSSSNCPMSERYCPEGGDCPQPICYGKCVEKNNKPTPTPVSFTCGGIQGKSCPSGYSCIYPTPNYPDAQGKCALSSKKTPSPLISCDPYQESIQCPTGYACVSVPCNAPEGEACTAVERYACMPQTTDNPPATPAPKVTSFKEGDVTGDGGIDFRDAIDIFRNLGKNECGSKYDVNKDCRVNTTDIRLVIQGYGR